MGVIDMLTAIETIIIKDRIRKDITKISELAKDIERNGLINPVTVMGIDDGLYQLLAGMRRVKAVQSLGHTEIEVKVVSPTDAEAILRIEISENEQREPFTCSEKAYYGRLLEDIELAKAKERMSAGGKGGIQQDSEGMDYSPYLESGTSRDAIGAKLGISGRQYDRIKYISENAPTEVIEKLDKGELSISSVYNELKAKEKTGDLSNGNDSADNDDYFEEMEDDGAEQGHNPTPQTKTPSPNFSQKLTCEPSAPQVKAQSPKPKEEPFIFKSDLVSEEEQLKLLSPNDREAVRKLKEFVAMSPEEKVKELERQLQEMTVRAVAAEAELETRKSEYGIKVDHKDSIITSLKRQNTQLREELEAAEKKIAELEK